MSEARPAPEPRLDFTEAAAIAVRMRAEIARAVVGHDAVRDPVLAAFLAGRPRPFMAMATQNPIEQEGTYPLPEAELDRFLFKVRIGYPEEAQEIALVKTLTDGRVGDELDVSAVGIVASAEMVVALQGVAARV